MLARMLLALALLAAASASSRSLKKWPRNSHWGTLRVPMMRGAAPAGLGRSAVSEHARGSHPSAGRLAFRRRGNRGRHFIHHDRPDTGKVEAAQERPHGQLAGAAQLHQEAHQRLADLAELARELVNAGQLDRPRLSRDR